MKSTRNYFRSISAAALAAIMLIMTVPHTFADENNRRNVDTIIEMINEEYGTNIHKLSSEELKKYGIQNESTESKDEIDLDAFEAELRHIAEVEIPKFERDSLEMVQLDVTIAEQDTVAATTTQSGPVVATKAIDYATAGSKAYVTTNNSGAKIWGTVVNTFCQTNVYQARWFFAQYPSVRKIDGGRTLYWQGTGDYGAYINGTQYYLSSGTQYAQLYVGNYA